MIRHNKFPEISNLDNELDRIAQAINELTGQDVKELPPINQVQNGATYNVLQSDGSYITYKKINNTFKRMKVDLDSFVYWE